MADHYPLVLSGGSTKRLPSGDTLLLRGALDVASAGAITLGNTTATDITIGRSGQTVTFPGNLTVQGIETVEGNTVLEEDVTLGDASDDRITMGGRFGTSGAPDFIFSNDANHTLYVENAAVGDPGKTLTLRSGNGGAASGVTAGAGANLTLYGGQGGAGDATYAAGAGGSITINAGGGGTAGVEGGGAGGNVSINAGITLPGGTMGMCGLVEGIPLISV